MNRVLKHDKNEFKIIEIENLDGFLINSKKNNYEIKIIEDELIKKIINDNFINNYKRILNSIDDDNPDGNEHILKEIESYVIYIKNKFSKYLTAKELSKYVKMLDMVYQDIKIKVSEIKEEKSKIKINKYNN